MMTTSPQAIRRWSAIAARLTLGIVLIGLAALAAPMAARAQPPSSTTTTVAPSQGTITLGDTVTFTATVTASAGTPTGLVTFFDGTTPLGSGALNQASPDQATFSTALLSVGSDSITATYQGDANDSASSSGGATETVNLRGSTTAVSLNPTTVAAGQASTATVTVTDGGASTPPGTPDSFAPTGAPATGRTGFTATLFADGLVLVAGGTDAANDVLNSAEIYSASGGTFSSTGNLNTARTGAVAVLLPNGKVLIAGGSSDGTPNGALGSAELFDPASGTFTPTSQSMTAARFGATATLLSDGKVLIAGGENSGGVLNSAELYDPTTDTFTATGNLSSARTGASATLLGSGKVLIAGGSSDGTANGALASGELFDPTANSGVGTFTAISSPLSAGRWEPEAALLESGKVLVAGGQSPSGALAGADLYDPVANTFTATSHSMSQARAGGTAAALPNGTVLLAGGTTATSVDLYDPEGDKFDSTGSLQQSDAGLQSVLLNNGDVLVVGLTTAAIPASDAELYAPSFNPLGTIGFSSSDPSDVFGAPCTLTPGSPTASTCSTTVTPEEVGTSPHTITATYPADATHSGSSNTASLTVIPTAPPTIANSFASANVAENATTFVEFTITNPNPAATLTGISFTDALPAGLVIATPNQLSNDCGGTVTAVPGSSSISLTGGSLAPAGPPPQRHLHASAGDPATGFCNISIALLVIGTGTISNTTGPVSANQSGPGNPSNTASLQVVLPPTASIAFGAATIPQGGTTSLTFNIANPNSSNNPLDSIDLPDSLPAGLVVASPNGLTGSCASSSTISARPGAGSVELSFLNLAPSASCSFAVNVTGTTAGTKNNTTNRISAVYDDGSGDSVAITGGTASAALTVVAPPTVTTFFGAESVAVGASTSLSYTVANPNALALSGVAFTDTLPAGLVVSTPNGLSGSCDGGTVTATAGSGSVTLTGATLAGGATCTIAVNVTGTSEGVKQESTTASSTNGGTGAPSSASLFVGLPPSITSSFAPTSITLGSTSTLSFTVTNPNAATTLSGIAASDALGAGLVVASPSGAQGTCGGGTLTAVPGSGMFSFAGGQLAPGTSCTVSLIVQAIQPGIEQNTVGPVSSTQSGPAGSASATLTVALPVPSITGTPTITPTVTPSSNRFGFRHVKAQHNGNITFQITVPGPGTLDILETAPQRDFASIAAAGPQAPGPGRFAFARVHLTIARGETVTITVKPTAKTRKLLRRRHGRVKISLFVTFTPTNGLPATKAVFDFLVLRSRVP